MIDIETESMCNPCDMKDMKWARSVIFISDLHALRCITVI